MNRDQINRTLRKWLAESVKALSNAERYGENQEAFYYQVIDQSIDGRVLFRLVFFDGFIVDCLLTEAEFFQTGDA